MRGHASSAVPTTKLFINNKMVESKTNEWIDLRNPATNEVFLIKNLQVQTHLSLPIYYCSI